MLKDLNELWKDGFAEGVAEGRGGCAPSYSVDSCFQWSNGVWWVEVLSYHVFLSSSGMSHNLICMIINILPTWGPWWSGADWTGGSGSLSVGRLFLKFD